MVVVVKSDSGSTGGAGSGRGSGSSSSSKNETVLTAVVKNSLVVVIAPVGAVAVAATAQA